MKPALHIVPDDEPTPSPWLILSPQVRTLVAQITDDAARLRALERLPTAATVRVGKQALKRLAKAVSELEGAL